MDAIRLDRKRPFITRAVGVIGDNKRASDTEQINADSLMLLCAKKTSVTTPDYSVASQVGKDWENKSTELPAGEGNLGNNICAAGAGKRKGPS